MERKITKKVQGYRTTDGAGVSLVRVLARSTTDIYDPILMLDSFDSTNPDDYKAGFPMHPHRGIETVSLLSAGRMIHRDSLSNEDEISSGQVQWMTAGSGIMHEETLPASERLLGVQLWLNMPAKDKMAPPEYRAIKEDQIKEIPIEGGKLRLISGNYKEHSGYQPKYSPLDYYHIILGPGEKIKIDTENNKSVMVFTLLGDIKVAGEELAEKTAGKLSQGDYVDIESLDSEAEILFISSNRLDEPIAWGGPIVMNTKEELEKAFEELQTNQFLKDKIEY